jgi:hypothetical protein
VLASTTNYFDCVFVSGSRQVHSANRATLRLGAAKRRPHMGADRLYPNAAWIGSRRYRRCTVVASSGRCLSRRCTGLRLKGSPGIGEQCSPAIVVLLFLISRRHQSHLCSLLLMAWRRVGPKVGSCQYEKRSSHAKSRCNKGIRDHFLASSCFQRSWY